MATLNAKAEPQALRRDSRLFTQIQEYWSFPWNLQHPSEAEGFASCPYSLQMSHHHLYQYQGTRKDTCYHRHKGTDGLGVLVTMHLEGRGEGTFCLHPQDLDEAI